VKKDAPYNTIKEFTEAARAAPGKFDSGLVQGITEFTFWGYCADQKLDIAQVPYRDINVAPTDLGEGRIQVVMSSFAIVQPQFNAGCIKLLITSGKKRAPVIPDIPTAREAGYPSLEVDGLVGLFRLKTMSGGAQGEDRSRFPDRGGRRRYRRTAEEHGAGHQRRWPQGVRRGDRRAARQHRQGGEDDQLQAEELR
jgi:hypothetical protein